MSLELNLIKSVLNKFCDFFFLKEMDITHFIVFIYIDHLLNLMKSIILNLFDT